MNNLRIVNNEFNSGNISKYEFTISLIKECVRSGILQEDFLYRVQIKVGEILRELMIKFTKGESSSVSVERAEKLIIGIWYTVDAYMKSLENIELCIEALKNEEIALIYEKGKNILQEDFINTEKLYEKTIDNKIYTELTAYNDTLKGIEKFFKLYNMDFEPDECDGDIDYPLAFDDWNVQGLYYMQNYLWNLFIENEICNKFNNKDVNLVLKSYGDYYKIDYKDLLINIFELTITNAVFSKLCNNNSLKIKNEDFNILNFKLKQLNHEEIKKLLSLIIDKIIEEYELGEFESKYIKKYEKELIKNTIDMLKRDNLRNLLVITDKIKKKKNTIILNEENILSDEAFKEVINEILTSDNIQQKINIINNKINSIKDYIDMLKSDCLFEEEYIILFSTLSNMELAILGKYVFYGEYRMDKLDIIRTFSNKINTNYQWEDFYLNYLKSLDKIKLKELETIINEKL